MGGLAPFPRSKGEVWGPAARPDKKQQLQPGQRGSPYGERASDDNRNAACPQGPTRAASCKPEGLAQAGSGV